MGGGKGKKAKPQTVGWRYYLGMHMVACHGPVDNISSIKVGDKTIWNGSVTSNTQLSINQPNLYGGDSREGGVVGAVDVWLGGESQGQNDYLASMLGAADLPSFRGVVSVILRKIHISSNNPYLKPWSFYTTRIPKSPLGAAGDSAWWANHTSNSTIGGVDANPAHILFECLTHQQWGMGYSVGDVDIASFAAASVTLHAESFGLSIVLMAQQSVEDFINLILKHIEATLYLDQTTGLFTLKLIRGGYDPNWLPVIDESVIVDIDSFNRPGVADLVNQVTVIFQDGPSHKKVGVTVQDLGSVAMQNCVIGTTIEYLGISRAELANTVAMRDLKTLSQPLARLRFTANRRAVTLKPGDVFKWNWASYGITGLLMRVVKTQYGTLTDGKITVEAVEDVFYTLPSIFAVPPPTLWTDPILPPAPSPARKTLVAPYWLISVVLGESPTAISEIDLTSALMLYLVEHPGGSHSSYEAYTNTSANNPGTLMESGVVFTPNAQLGTSVDEVVTSFAITAGTILDQTEAGVIAAIDDELVYISSLTATTCTVVRGVLDTVPAPHTSGTRIWFFEQAYATDYVEYAGTGTRYLKALPTTPKGTLATGSAAWDSLVLNYRFAAPYPPGYVRVNGTLRPSMVTANTDLSLAWVHRDRTNTLLNTVGHDSASSYGPEAGTTYTVKVYNAKTNGTLIRTYSAIATTSQAYTAAQAFQDNNAQNLVGVRIEVTSVRSTYSSLQPVIRAFDWVVDFGGRASWTRLRMEGADGSQVFDEDAKRIVTVVGTTQTDTALYVEGLSSALFAANGGLVISPHGDLVPGRADFTIRVNIRPNANVGIHNIVDWYPDSNRSGTYLWWRINNNIIEVFFNGAVRITGTTNVSGAWHDVELSRKDGVLRLFVDGEQQGSAYYGHDIQISKFRIGDCAQSIYRFSGSMDHFYMERGTGHHDATFTPSTTAVPTSTLPKTVPILLMHMEANNNAQVFREATGRTYSASSGAIRASTSIKKLNTSAMYFPGSANRIVFPASTDFMFARDIVVDAFVYLPTALGNTAVVFATTSQTGTYYCDFAVDVSRRPAFVIGGSQINSATVLSLNTWYHVRWVRKFQSYSVYVDGTLVFVYYGNGSPFNSVLGNTATGAYVGAHDAAGTWPFVGYIDELSVWGANEHCEYPLNTAKYPVGGGDPLWANVVSLLRMEGTTGATSVTDDAGNVVTLFGGATVIADGDRHGAGALNLPAAGAFALINNAAINCSTGNFTMECDIYYGGNTDTYNKFISTTFGGNTTWTTNAIQLQVDRSGGGTPHTLAVGLWVYDIDSGNAAIKAYDYTVTMNTWCRVTVLRTGTTLALYIDEKLMGLRTISAGVVFNWNGSTGMRIGDTMQGRISNFRLTKALRSDPTMITVPVAPIAIGSLLVNNGLDDTRLAQGWTVSNSWRTALRTVSSWDTLRTALPKLDGKRYFEVTVDAVGDKGFEVGLVNESHTLTTFMDNSTNGWCYYAVDGRWYYNSGAVGVANALPVTGTVLGFVVDRTSGTNFTISLYVNGTLQATTYTPASAVNTTVPLYPAIAARTNGIQLTINLGEQPFAIGTPPASSVAWNS